MKKRERKKCRRKKTLSPQELVLLSNSDGGNSLMMSVPNVKTILHKAAPAKLYQVLNIALKKQNIVATFLRIHYGQLRSWSALIVYKYFVDQMRMHYCISPEKSNYSQPTLIKLDSIAYWMTMCPDKCIKNSIIWSGHSESYFLNI
jgi:hypothetical protein